MPKLSIEQPTGKTVAYEVLDDDVSIGRSGSNEIQIEDRRASKNHGRIRRVYGRWKYVDLESKNGTRVNGRYRNQHWLQPGDALQIGETWILFDAPEGTRPPKPKVAPAVAPAVVPKAPVAPSPVAPAAVAKAPKAPKAPAAPAAPKRSRAERKRGLPTWLVFLLAIVGIGGLGFLMFTVFQPKGPTHSDTLFEAEKLISRSKNYKEAIAYARRVGVPGQPGWDRLQADIRRWEARVKEAQAYRTMDNEAEAWLEKELGGRVGWDDDDVPEADRLTDVEIAESLKSFLRRYGDSRSAIVLVGMQAGPPWEKYREVLRAHPVPNVDLDLLEKRLEEKIAPLVEARRYGDAAQVLEYELRVQGLLLPRESYERFDAYVNPRIESLQTEATDAFEALLREVKTLAAEEQYDDAKMVMTEVIEVFGVPNVEAQARLRRADLITEAARDD